MKAIKYIMIFCALAAIPAFGDVEALYWQITSENNPDVYFTHAVLVGVNDSNPGQKSAYADSAGSIYQAALAGNKTTEVIASVLDSSVDYSGWKFYVELWNYSNDNWVLAGTAGAPGTSYSTLKNDSMIRSSMSMSTALFTPTAVIPEPTSGLLVLVGGALLALRRRRRA